MPSRCPFLTELWYDLSGKKYTPPKPKLLPSLEELKKSEWCPEFEEMMRNRMILGAMRYGLISENYNKNYDYIDNAIARLNEYKETGNQENLVDCANIVMVAYMLDKHPKKHFYSRDDESIHLKED